MSFWFTAWLWIAAPIAAIWLFRVLVLEVALRSRCVLSEHSSGSPTDSTPKVSILLAAKDEEENIAACVRSLLAQDYRNSELIVVDDRSTDRTGAILAGLAEEFPGRLRTIRIQTLPPGWFGKHNAMRMGVRQAKGDWFLFTDADCRQTSTKTLSVAMHEAKGRGADFLSIIPNLERKTFWEHVLQPVCAVILMVWFRPGRVNRPELPTAYANGAFMLMSRACYEAIGGHDAVRDRINEDIPMARIAKQRGQRLFVAENEGLYVARMYNTPIAAFRGWSRIFYGCLEKPARITAALALVMVAGLFPWLSLLIATAGAFWHGGSRWWIALAVWGAVVALSQFALARFYHSVGYGLLWSFTYVLGAACTAAILFSALLKAMGLRGTTWRRTTYTRSIGLTGSSAIPASPGNKAAG